MIPISIKFEQDRATFCEAFRFYVNDRRLGMLWKLEPMREDRPQWHDGEQLYDISHLRRQTVHTLSHELVSDARILTFDQCDRIINFFLDNYAYIWENGQASILV